MTPLMNRPEFRVLETSAGPQALGDIELALEKTWSAYPHVPTTVRMHMGIAVGEIGANIVEHAARGDSVWIWMDIEVHPGLVRVAFTDNGVPAQVDLESVVLPDDMAERGRGLALALTCLGNLSYSRTDVNHWTLVSKPFG